MENAEETPTLEGMVGLPSHPRTMSSWPLDLACSFDNVSL